MCKIYFPDISENERLKEIRNWTEKDIIEALEINQI
jgi:hypothetical protein